MKGLAVTTSMLLIICGSCLAQKTYQVDVSHVKTDVLRRQLNLGGRNPAGDSIGVTSFYLEKNKVPFIPVIGEFHYSRYPHQYWDEELKKMKAGGITVVATYVFWNLHEFKEGKFDWGGDLDVRNFVELCAKNGLNVLMRIGPFAHGEMRNGGLPDWLYGRPIDMRSNDQEYLYYVNRFYAAIGAQLKGLMFGNGGPVIGVQIENEYQHSAAPWGFTYDGAPREKTSAGRDRKIIQDGVGINAKGNEFAGAGSNHMKKLKELAIKAGLIVPVYTATGWGFATIIEKGSIPVMAGYAYPFWTAKQGPSPFYLYKDIQAKPDYAPVSYDTKLYPSLAAELGTGMANTYSRRPRVPGESFLPLMVRTVGSGTNGLGFYMYHGGTTPSVGNYFLSEGSGLASKSYDYQAPIGEFGKAGDGFYSLKLINYFLKYYGQKLAPLYPVIPATNDSIKATDNQTLRYAVRSDGNSGYLFMHNFQDHQTMQDLTDLRISVKTKTGTLSFPEKGTFKLMAGNSAVFPFNTDFDGVPVRMATMQPYCHFTNKNRPYHVLVSINGIDPELMISGHFKVRGNQVKSKITDGNTMIRITPGKIAEFQVNGVSFLVLPEGEAKNAYMTGKAGNERLVISRALVLEDDKQLFLISDNNEKNDVAIYPGDVNITSRQATIMKGPMSSRNICNWLLGVQKVDIPIRIIKADESHFVIKAQNLDLSKINDVFVTFDYRGDRGICMMDGELQTDDLYSSKPWVIGLKRYQEALKNNDMYFYFTPMYKDAPYLSYLDKEVIPDFGNKKSFLEVKPPIITIEYKIPFEISSDQDKVKLR